MLEDPSKQKPHFLVPSFWAYGESGRGLYFGEPGLRPFGGGDWYDCLGLSSMVDYTLWGDPPWSHVLLDSGTVGAPGGDTYCMGGDFYMLEARMIICEGIHDPTVSGSDCASWEELLFHIRG